MAELGKEREDMAVEGKRRLHLANGAQVAQVPPQKRTGESHEAIACRRFTEEGWKDRQAGLDRRGEHK